MNRTVMTATAALLALGLAGCASGTDDAGAGAAVSTAAAQPSAAGSAPAQSAPTETAAAETASPAPESSAPAEPGAWIDRAAYDADPARFHMAGDVVLFFNAAWCPTCRQTVENLDADGVPAGLTVVSVDYDDSAALKKQYGVTVQHTFVQVDKAGESLAKFTGSLTGAEIAARTA